MRRVEHWSEESGEQRARNEAEKGGSDRTGKGPAGCGFLLEVMGNHWSILSGGLTMIQHLLRESRRLPFGDKQGQERREAEKKLETRWETIVIVQVK